MVISRLLAFVRRRSTWLSFLILVLTGLVFSKVCTFDFTTWDDTVNVVDNQYLQPFTLHNIVHFWTHPYFQLYIPLSYMAFALVGIAANLASNPLSTEFATSFNPHIFHLANLVLHLVNVVLVFSIIRRTVKSDVAAFLGTMLFALHPLQVESVAWVSELRGLLGSAFALTSALIYLSADSDDEGGNVAYVWSTLFFILSLLAKPSGIALPVVLFFWSVYFLRTNYRQTLLRLIPWLVFAAGDVIVTRHFQPVEYYTALPPVDRLVVALDALGFYVDKLFCPFNLAAEYGRTPNWLFSHPWERSAVPMAVFALAACAFSGKRNRWIVFCAAIFILFLLPVSGLVPFTYQYRSTVADRYVYLAMIGPSLGLAYFIAKARTDVTKRTAVCVASSVLVLLACRTYMQLSTWQNTRTLFANVLTVNPEDWLPYNQLGGECLRNKDYVGAERDYNHVLALGYSDKYLWTSLGDAVQGAQRYNDACLDYDRALAMSPVFAPALYGKARCEALAGEPTAAIVDYRAALRYLPPTSYADYELAVELYAVGQYRLAAEEFSQTVEEHPDYMPSYYLFAMTYTKMGLPKLARDIANVALARDPEYSPVFPFVSVAANQTKP